MPAVFTLQDIRSALREHEEELVEFRDSIALEQVARARRWLDQGEDAPLFAEAAAELERSWRENGTGSRGSWATAGGLWHLAGERQQARRALTCAIVNGTDWEPAPQGAAGVLYLLGELDRAAQLAPDGPEGWLAAAARDRDVSLVTRARERIIAWQRHEKRGPHHDWIPRPLSPWDWIEETYRLEAELRGEPAPSHLEMLRRSGLLREHDEPMPAPPQRPAARVGFRVALGPRADGTPSLEVVNERLVVSELAPDLILHLGHYPADEGWGVQLAAGPNEGEWVLSPSEPDFQSAGLWAADWLQLRGDALAAHNLRRLIEAHDAPR